MNYENVTFVFAMPRSRTAWLAWFLDQQAIPHMRDPLAQCASIDELRGKIDARLAEELPGKPLVVIDTALMFFTDKIVEGFPGARYVVIYRDFREVRGSLRRKGVFSLSLQMLQEAAFERTCHKLLMVNTNRGFLIQFGDLADMNRLIRLMEYMTGTLPHLAWPAGQWSRFCHEAIQTNIDIPLAEQEARIDRWKARKLFAGILPGF